MIIKFSDDTDVFTWGAVLEGLAGWTLKMEYAIRTDSENFPEQCSIDSTNRNDLVICDVDEIGRPMPNSLYHVPWESIASITVL